MKIGTLLHIELRKPGNNGSEKYRCKVVAMNEHYLFIDYPINNETMKTVFLPKGTALAVTYIGGDQVIYYFHTEIIAKLKLTVPALAITYSKETTIKRIQRREFVRIETAADIAVHSPEKKFSPFTTVTSDISGGGMSIITPKNKKIGVDQVVDVWLTIQFISGEYYYIYAESEVILIKMLNNSFNKVSLKFHSITKAAQQNIIRYCFEKQREARKKELQ